MRKLALLLFAALMLSAGCAFAETASARVSVAVQANQPGSTIIATCSDSSPSSSAASSTQAQIEYMRSKIPMGRFGSMDEVAALICWPASEECSFSTGAAFDISGGRATY